MTLRASALTDIGHHRPQNEDNLLCDPAHGLFAVADGIGGLPGGAQASRRTVEAIAAWFARQGDATTVNYPACLAAVNNAVYLLGHQLSPRQGIGSTLTLAHFTATHLHLVHVGDSFLFRWRGGALTPLTLEHNIENELRARAARGEPAYATHENRAALTRCIGQPPPLAGDFAAHPLAPGDRYLLCSDGVTRGAPADDLSRHLATAPDPEAACRALVDTANERGGYDNATAVVVFVE